MFARRIPGTDRRADNIRPCGLPPRGRKWGARAGFDHFALVICGALWYDKQLKMSESFLAGCRPGGAVMEYVSMVDQIIAAEHNAKLLTEENRQQEEQVRAGLEQEIQGLRERYMGQARRKVEEVRQAEQASAREQIARLEEKQARALERMQAAYEKNHDRWEDVLFGMIVGVGP